VRLAAGGSSAEKVQLWGSENCKRSVKGFRKPRGLNRLFAI